MVIKILCTIFLDLDGTLLDTSERHYKLYRDLLNLDGLVGIEKEKYWHMKRQGKKTYEILSKDSPEHTISFEEEWLHKIEKKSYLKYDILFPGVKETLNLLAENFYLVLVTLRNDKENLNWELSHLTLSDYFNGIISGKGPKKKLIENYLIQKCIREKCLIVGDTEEDILTGLKLNIPTISATYGIRSKKFLEQFNPNFYINSFNEILNVLMLIKDCNQTKIN